MPLDKPPGASQLAEGHVLVVCHRKRLQPVTIPYCTSTKDAVDLSCPAATGAHTGTCGDHWAVRYVYGFPGDFYECIYDASTGVLVGAKWSPDNHPTQFAGEQLPASCQLTTVCDVSDAGTDAPSDTGLLVNSNGLSEF